jgi:uncharacterized Ntn-hydrolase superfamily protein
VTSQNVTNPDIGVHGLQLLAGGMAAGDVLGALLEREPHPDYRQVSVVDTRGGTACHSGRKTLGRHAHAVGQHCVAAGNLLASEGVPEAMVAAMERHRDAPLAPRLLAALEAGLNAGGEAGEVRSAGMLVVETMSWPVVDLRVDWHEMPIAALRDLWREYEPQMRDYVTRALDPASAPAYGVPGDP